MSYVICEQQRRHCFSLLREYNNSRFYSWNFKTLASFCGCAGRFVSSLVGNSRRHILSCRGLYRSESDNDFAVYVITKNAKLANQDLHHIDWQEFTNERKTIADWMCGNMQSNYSIKHLTMLQYSVLSWFNLRYQVSLGMEVKSCSKSEWIKYERYIRYLGAAKGIVSPL